MTKLLERFRTPFTLAFHTSSVAISIILAFLLRFDFALPADQAPIAVEALIIGLIVKLPVFYLARLHSASWRYAGIRDLGRLFVANGVASLGFTVAAMVLLRPLGFPRSVCLIDLLACVLLTGGGQFAVRAYNELRSAVTARPGAACVLIYGAGSAGRMLLREIQSNPSLGYESSALWTMTADCGVRR